jgi:hypothetical protein
MELIPIIIIALLTLSMLASGGYIIYDTLNPRSCPPPTSCPHSADCPPTPTYKFPLSLGADLGYADDTSRPVKRGFYDVQNQGLALDYCRYTGDVKNPVWTCALGGSTAAYTLEDATAAVFKNGPVWKFA